MKPLLTVFTLVLSVIALSSCANTLQGVGEDIERAGEGLQRVAK
jgi:predicted small secreted protein